MRGPRSGKYETDRWQTPFTMPWRFPSETCRHMLQRSLSNNGHYDRRDVSHSVVYQSRGGNHLFR